MRVQGAMSFEIFIILLVSAPYQLLIFFGLDCAGASRAVRWNGVLIRHAHKNVGIWRSVVLHAAMSSIHSAQPHVSRELKHGRNVRSQQHPMVSLGTRTSRMGETSVTRHSSTPTHTTIPIQSRMASCAFVPNTTQTMSILMGSIDIGAPASWRPHFLTARQMFRWATDTTRPGFSCQTPPRRTTHKRAAAPGRPSGC
jgi:hypothetical protein